MTAAETGHLVLGTLHTTGAVKTIDRIIDALPGDEREQTKSFLSQSLIAVITQVLVARRPARPASAICEVMLMTTAIAKLIQTGPDVTDPLRSCRSASSQACRPSTSALGASQAREADISGRDGVPCGRQEGGLRGLPALTARTATARADLTPRSVRVSREPRSRARPDVPSVRDAADRSTASCGCDDEPRGSDFHLVVGRPPIAARLAARWSRSATARSPRPTTSRSDAADRAAAAVGGVHGTGDVDLAYEVPGVARFRVNLFRQPRGSGAVFRVIPTKI